MDVISRAANLTQKADESLGDAERLIDGRSFDIAALRCYHAVFFLLRAYLIKKAIIVEKKSDSIRFFQESVKQNDSEDALSDLSFVMRLNGYQDPAIEVSETSVLEGFQRAERFYHFTIENSITNGVTNE